jgi:hypothetical protein
MLDRAKFLIVSEIAEVEGKPIPAIEERVDKALSKAATLEPKPLRQKPVGAVRARRADA